MKRVLSVAALLLGLAPAAAWAQEFTYNPPGQLTAGSGTGRFDENVYVPGMRFPIESAPAFANSQVWGHGGGSGPGGGQCDVENFSYPWWDNYCETRSWDMPLCPSGTGHQGQDIRASTCDNNVHWVVAAESGTVTSIGSYSVYITSADGTRFDYLHMGSVQVSEGQSVTKGAHIGKVSNAFGGTPTTVHLHFNLRQSVAGVGTVYVPPYLSLVTSYQALVGPPVEPETGALEEVACESIRGWTQSPSDPDAPIDVRLYFDGEAGDGSTIGHPFLADVEREDLCDALGSCEHGFEVVPPLSLFDGTEHAVRGYASDGAAGSNELEGSPKPMSCTFQVPSGVRRQVKDAEVANAWRFSPFWDQIEVSDGIVESLEEGPALDSAPRLVASSSDPERLWLLDGGAKREVASVLSALAWDFDPIAAEVVPDDELASYETGKPVRARPIVLRTATGELWLVDDEASTSTGPGGGPNGDGDGDGDGNLDDGGDDVSSGCSCQLTSPAAPSWTVLLGLAALGLPAIRRRRRGR